MAAAAASGRWEDAVRLFDSARAQGDLLPIPTLRVALSAHVALGSLPGVDNVIESALGRSGPPGAIGCSFYAPAVQFYVGTGRPKQARALLAALAGRGIKPYVFLYNLILSSCAREGDLDALAGVLADMASFGVEPNTVTMNTVLAALTRRGRYREALHQFERMRAAGVKPDERTARPVCIALAAVEGKVAAAA